MKHNYNGNSFTVYDDELSMLEIVDEHHKAIVNKTDLYGDHKGSWQGLNRPTLSEEGMRATVEQHIEKIEVLEKRNETIRIVDTTNTDITSALTDAINKGGEIRVGAGNFTISSTIVVKRGVRLILDKNCVIKPTGNFNILEVEDGAQLEGGIISWNGVQIFSSAGITLKGEFLYLPSHGVTSVKGVTIRGNSDGVGIQLVCNNTVERERVQFVTFRDINIEYCRVGLHCICTNTGTWINSNLFQNFYLIDCGKCMVSEGVEGTEFSGNKFLNFTIQSGAELSFFEIARGKSNIADIYVWDYVGEDVKIKLGSGAFSNNLTIYGDVNTKVIQDLGWRNIIHTEEEMFVNKIGIGSKPFNSYAIYNGDNGFEVFKERDGVYQKRTFLANDVGLYSGTNEGDSSTWLHSYLSNGYTMRVGTIDITLDGNGNAWGTQQIPNVASLSFVTISCDGGILGSTINPGDVNVMAYDYGTTQFKYHVKGLSEGVKNAKIRLRFFAIAKL